ncbi:acyltransferase family protein [Micromonospora mirobrigensis]|uniref:Peptidoglycan/LPS O-acetylase OafA/YrhL, contains acyltransferase and SGNH-hydrolase domains n=1 Tax=Micromonospora mirobrigensis TaxID=262898 RepID=A0A1C4ZL39_9ACTN|nr:acyltransferase [Micromonospora mirobrigensis]SCF33638.1 Peptidoglycan/LPS O-acetylase OafA/YrhL, contains acyltransferase and SGNH-hydrolase domains [Micromonospora mirobrigensis]
MSAPIPDQVLRRLPALDAVRVIGALAVVGHHVGFATGRNTGDSAVGAWLSRLDVGVAVFFVLSGFLLFRPYAHAHATYQRPPATGRYLWRRATRILPAYWVAVVVCLLVLPQNRDAGRADWLRHATLTQIYQHGQLKHGLSQTWSLATEVTFYLLLPVLAGLALRGRPTPDKVLRIAAGALAVTVAWVALLGSGLLSLGLHTMWLPSYAGWFGAGMALAAAHVALRTGTGDRWRWLDDLGRAPLTCWAVALAALAVATTPVTGPRDLAEPTAGQFATKLVLYLVVAVMLILPIAFGPQTRTKGTFDSLVGRWLGRVSYGLFLWHPFVLETIYVVDGRPEFTGDPLSTWLLTVAGGLVLAAASYYLIERPFQRWGGQWPGRRRSTSESQRAVTAVTAAN